MKKIFWIITAIATLLAILPVQAETLKIGVDCTYPPFHYRDASGQLKGFDVDIANEIGRRLGVELAYVCPTWDALIPGLLAKKYDLIVASMDITPERQKRIDFSIPYFLSVARFVGPKSMANAPLDVNGRLAPEFLKGKVVGLLRASIYERYLSGVYKGVELVRYDSMDNVLLDLKTGRIDLAFTDALKAEYDFPGGAERKDFTLIGPRVEDFEYLGGGSAVGIRKGRGELRERINAALKTMFEDGTYAKINQKYWPFSVMPGLAK